MKIYASDLLDITQVLTGNILEIADAHTTAGVDTSTAQGLIITGGNANRWIKGTGQEAVVTNDASGRVPIAVNSTDNTIDGASDADLFINSSYQQLDSGHVQIQQVGGGAANLTVTGDLVVLGDSSILEGADTITEAKYITVNTNVDDTGVVQNAAASEDGGILVQRETAIRQTSASSGTDGTHGGIRFDESTGRWQTATATTSTGGVQGDWTDIGSGSGTVDKYAETCTLAANGTIIAIISSNVDAGGASPTHSLAGSDFSVKTFIDDGVAYEEVIPEAIYNVHTAGSVEGAQRAIGTVVIKFPVLDVSSATNIRVVIKG